MTEAKKFGTFGGVFTPCTLTILGVIMFLRYGQVVGESGLFNALIILAIAKLITTLTTMSLSAIATNTKVQGGGAYFLISRSLGVEFGGAIGVVFYLAQAISVSMYVVGFAEAFCAVFPGLGLSLSNVASFTNLVVFICVWIGAGWTIKLQYGILAVLVLSLLSFFSGVFQAFSPEVLRTNLASHYPDGSGFFSMFALFFPAVTGIMAGANMSGDLQNPAAAIPKGTFGAVIFTAIVYALMGVGLAGVADSNTLQTDSLVVKSVSLVPWLITGGVFAATLSSALGSMMGAPRILQALAKDEIFPSLRRFGQGQGPANEPRAAVVVTFVIAQCAVLLGDLDAIAPVITMAFMITYGTLNLATFYESITRNPSYRPTFRYSHWLTALLGALGCVAVMFLMEPVWATVSIIGMCILHYSISRREIEASWGDVHSGVAFERARKNLHRLEQELEHPKNWRPIILALSGNVSNRQHLVTFGYWLTAGRGILSVAQLIISESMEQSRARVSGQEEILQKYLNERKLQAFPAVHAAETLERGVEALVQCHGLGSLKPNTILMSWPDSPERYDQYGRTLSLIQQQNRSIVLCSSKSEPDDVMEAPMGTIDVWWRGEGNGAKMLLLAHLLTQNRAWRHRSIRLLRMIPNEAGRGDVLKHLGELITDSRIKAHPVAVVADDFKKTVRQESQFAAVVFLGFEVPEPEQSESFCERVNELMESFRNVMLVKSMETGLLH